MILYWPGNPDGGGEEDDDDDDIGLGFIMWITDCVPVDGTLRFDTPDIRYIIFRRVYYAPSVYG